MSKNVLHKQWIAQIRTDLVLKEIRPEQNYVGTFWVIDITRHVQRECYLIIAINRLVRTILCTTTAGFAMDCGLFHHLCNLKEDGQYYACVSLRIGCEKYHQPLVIHLADRFTNTLFDPTDPMLRDNEILKKYNIITLNKQQQQIQHNQEDDTNSPNTESSTQKNVDDIRLAKTPQLYEQQGYRPRTLKIINKVLGNTQENIDDIRLARTPQLYEQQGYRPRYKPR